MPDSPHTFQGQPPIQLSKQERGYGGEWERISKAVRAEHPVCQMCGESPSEQVDHIVPFSGPNDPLRTDRDNLQALCFKCHDLKTRHGMSGQVVLVTGPPGSGKTTYVRHNATADDLIWDMDEIAATLCPGGFPISEYRREYPQDIRYLLYDIRQQIIKHINGRLLNRTCWIIWADEHEARTQLTGKYRVVRMKEHDKVSQTENS